MKILVTGGAGFIGSALCRALVADGEDQVLNIDALTYAASPESLTPCEGSNHYRFVQADIRDAGAIQAAFEGFQPDAVMHLAAESHVDRSITGARDFVETNVVGTYVMLQAALDHWRSLPDARQEAFRFLHISTDEVFGSLGADGYFTETTARDPRSPYSASKAASDHLVSAWHHTYGLPILISNCSNNYGPYQFPEKLIPLITLNAMDGRPLPVYGDGSNIRDWLYVEDHVAALRLVLAKGRPGHTYNVGGRNERTNLEVVQRICDLMDEMAPALSSGPRRGLITHVTDRPGHDHRYAIDAAKLEGELGWRASETFETGLAKTVRWYLDRKDWWTPLRERYAGQRLGLKTGA
ncbi:MAG TPA: dTDP-glucose 4,6-dehydratase [Caulobacteraceae bacterium]|jgi:dTDP-glucose 4,6-dehydratase|nr:dTDP-glucose 4,6-dehydratase [Caulobacteraceae bacterium]